MLFSKTLTATALGLFGALLFSAKAIVVKLAYLDGHSTMEIIGMRMVLSLPVFLVLLVFQLIYNKEHRVKITKLKCLQITGFGFMGYYFASYMDFLGLQFINASLERLILFTYPTVVILLNQFFLKEKLTARKVASLLITYLGIVLAIGVDAKESTNILLGSWLVFIAACVFALYVVFSKKILDEIGAGLFTPMVMSFSSVFIVTHMMVESQLLGIEINLIDLNLFQHGIILAIFCTVLPAYMMIYAMQVLGTTKVALLGTLGPIGTILLGFILLGETLSFIQCIGSVFVIGGVLLITGIRKA